MLFFNTGGKRLKDEHQETKRMKRKERNGDVAQPEKIYGIKGVVGSSLHCCQVFLKGRLLSGGVGEEEEEEEEWHLLWRCFRIFDHRHSDRSPGNRIHKGSTVALATTQMHGRRLKRQRWRGESVRWRDGRGAGAKCESVSHLNRCGERAKCVLGHNETSKELQSRTSSRHL